MEKDEKDHPDSFRFTIENANFEKLALQQIIELRAQIDALIVLIIERWADSKEDAKEIARRYDELRQDATLRRLCFARYRVSSA